MWVDVVREYGRGVWGGKEGGDVGVGVQFVQLVTAVEGSESSAFSKAIEGWGIVCSVGKYSRFFFLACGVVWMFWGLVDIEKK